MGAGRDGRAIVEGVARKLVAEDHQWLVLPRREFLLGREISGPGGAGISAWGRAAARLPLAFARRGFPALLRGALPEAGHLHLRRAGIRAVAVPPNRIFEADAANGRIKNLPGRDGHAFARANGLSRRA